MKVTINIEAGFDADGGLSQITRLEGPMASHPKLCVAILRAAIRAIHRGHRASQAIVLPSLQPSQLLLEAHTPGEVGCLLDLHGAKLLELALREAPTNQLTTA